MIVKFASIRDLEHFTPTYKPELTITVPRRFMFAVVLNAILARAMHDPFARRDLMRINRRETGHRLG